MGLGSATVDASFPSTFYVRFTSDGTTVRAQRSADGETWPNTGNATNLNGLTNPKIGMYATASTAGGAQANTARFDSSARRPAGARATSSTARRWTCAAGQLVRHQPTGYSVATAS